MWFGHFDPVAAAKPVLGYDGEPSIPAMPRILRITTSLVISDMFWSHAGLGGRAARDKFVPEGGTGS